MDKHKKRGFAQGGTFVPLVVVAGMAVTMAPAVAAPVKLGQVRGLDVAITKPADRYVVASDWSDLAGATAYRVSLTSGGTVLQSDKVTNSDWRATTVLGAGTKVTLKVVPLAGKRPGKQTSISRDLPDLTAPVGTFHVVQSGPNSAHIEVVQDTLSDDVPGTITRAISWDELMPFDAWGDGTHDYAEDMRAYRPSVKLQDVAGNTREVSLGTVVVGDETPPEGAFGATSSGWARWTKVALTETLPATDNFSDAAKVTRTVEWGDGSTDTWTGGSAPTHVYAAAGTFNPAVTLTDEAGNESPEIAVNSVQVTEDSGRPTVSLTKPATRRTWVRKWVTLRGKTKDAATGVRVVRLRLVEKRGGTWYAYRSGTRRWVRGGSTQAAAVRRTTLATVRPTAKGNWSYQVRGLRKGRFVVQVRAVDNVANVSRFRAVAQTLNHS